MRRLARAFPSCLCDLALMLCFLLFAGALYLIVWDQRYRCRVCLRRLRMPIETGSWSRILLFGRPQIEYICPYGHGTLREDDLHISGCRPPSGLRIPTISGPNCAPPVRKPTAVNPVPRWRIAAAVAVLAALLGFGVLFAPIYAGQSQTADLRGRNYTSCRTARINPTRPAPERIG